MVEVDQVRRDLGHAQRGEVGGHCGHHLVVSEVVDGATGPSRPKATRRRPVTRLKKPRPVPEAAVVVVGLLGSVVPAANPGPWGSKKVSKDSASR